MPLTTSELEAQVGTAPDEPGPVAKTVKAVGGAVSKGASAVSGYEHEQWLRAVAEHNRLAQQYNEQIEKDYQYTSKGLIPDVLHSGKFALDLTQRFFAAPEAAVRSQILEPLQKTISQLGDLVSNHAAAEDFYDAQARREGKPVEKYPKGVDWKVHKSDVKRTVEDLNEQVEAAMYAGAMFVGPKGGKGVPEAKLSAAQEARIAKPRARVVDGEIKPVEPETIKPPEKPRLQIVGQTEAGKPRVRVMTPEETAAGTSQTMREVHAEVLSPKSTTADMVHGASPAAQLYHEWIGPHANTLNLYQQAYTRGVGVGAHQLLGRLIEGTREGYVRNYLTRLHQYVDDVQVNFVDTITDHVTGESDKRWNGQYDAVHHQVDVKFSPASTETTRTLIHELTHAATHRFIVAHPDHPLVEELDALLEEARYRAKNHPVFKEHYGLTNRSEFVAEAMSKPGFQTFLMRSGSFASAGWKGAKNLVSELARIIQRMFNIPDGPESSLLHRSMRNAEDLMKEQQKRAFSIEEDPVGMPGELQIVSAPKDIKLPRVSKDSPVVRKLGGWIDDMIKQVNPEGRGPSAKLAGAVLAHRVTEFAQRQIALLKDSTRRSDYWFKNPQAVNAFISQYESGKAFTDPHLQAMANSYRTWAEDIYRRDTKVTRLRYDPVDNYIPRLFETADRDDITNLFNQRYGNKWGDPKFIKDRGFSLFEEAVAAGFKPKYKTPEDMMLARERASDMASLQTSLLEDLWDYGVATPARKGVEQPRGTSPRRAPNGDVYYVDNKAFHILHQYFDTESFWSAESFGGSAFRGAMWLKNGIVPIKLGASGFHPLHIMLGIDNSAAISRTIESAAVEGGWVRAPAKVLASWMTNFLPWKSLSTNPYYGGLLVRAFDNYHAGSALRDYQTQAVQYMLEGGYNPHLHSVYQQAGIRTIRGELQRLSANSTWRLPLAVVNTLTRRLLFEKWIPALKTQSYIKDVETAIKMDPTLLDDDAKRIQRFTQIRKSVDNRYGEMNYDTLFWNRKVKDLGVLNTLSLGWQLGFAREFGGGTLDLAKYGAQLHKTGRVERVAQGDLHKAIYSSIYLTNVGLYGGLMTWAMTGEAPSSLEDYIFPRIGGTNPDGSPKRVTTMFYTREPAMVAAHVREEGLFKGLASLAASKSSGIVGGLIEFGTGLNQFNEEYRNPDGSWQKRTQQTLAHALGDLEPISIQNLQGDTLSEKLAGVSSDPGQAARSFAGFTPAPKYITDSPVESEIKSYFRKYVKAPVTPYDQAQYSQEYAQARKLYAAGDPGYEDVIDKMAEEHGLSDTQRRNIIKNLDSEDTPLQRMFKQLKPAQQKHLLDKMTPEEREQYMPFVHKQLRNEYEAPAAR